jgi:hypothetical protein
MSVGTDKLNIDTNAPDMEKLGEGSNVFYRKRFKTLELEGLSVANPLVLVEPDKLKGALSQRGDTGTNIRDLEATRLPDLTIGTNILSKLHIYFATREKKLYVTPASGPAAGAAQ